MPRKITQNDLRRLIREEMIRKQMLEELLIESKEELLQTAAGKITSLFKGVALGLGLMSTLSACSQDELKRIADAKNNAEVAAVVVKSPKVKNAVKNALEEKGVDVENFEEELDIMGDDSFAAYSFEEAIDAMKYTDLKNISRNEAEQFIKGLDDVMSHIKQKPKLNDINKLIRILDENFKTPRLKLLLSHMVGELGMINAGFETKSTVNLKELFDIVVNKEYFSRFSHLALVLSMFTPDSHGVLLGGISLFFRQAIEKDPELRTYAENIVKELEQMSLQDMQKLIKNCSSVLKRTGKAPKNEEQRKTYIDNLKKLIEGEEINNLKVDMYYPGGGIAGGIQYKYNVGDKKNESYSRRSRGTKITLSELKQLIRSEIKRSRIG